MWVRLFGTRDARAVLLIHGYRRTGWTFLPLLESLGHDHNRVVPDLPGHGETVTVGDDRSAPSFDELTEAMELLRRDLGIARWVVLGHSLGGSVAALYASRHPDRTRALVLLESTPIVGAWAKSTDCENCPLLPVDEAMAKLNDAVHGADFYPALWEAYERVDATAVFADRSLPILWLMNTDDRIDRDHFERLATRVAGDAMSHVHLETVYRRGHFVHWTGAEAVGETVLRYLKALPDR